MLRILLLIALALAACNKPTKRTPDAAAVAVAIDIEDPATCAACHPAVLAEWQESMHASAHPAGDAVVAAMVRFREAKEGAGLAAQCASCHEPRVAGRGVTCATCHAVAHVAAAGGPGVKRMTPTAGGLLLGPHDLTAGAAKGHATGAAPPHMKDGAALCLACHDELKNAQGTPICTTGPEWHAAGGETCVSCHMPVAAGPATQGGTRAEHRAHRFVGPHASAPLLATRLEGRFDGDAAVVTVHNLAPHGWPTGFPARVGMLEIVGLDAAGKEVWKSEADGAFVKTYADAEGKPTIGPWAAKVTRDSRLTAGEARPVRAEGVPKEVATVRARLSFRLVAPSLADKLKVEAAPRLVAELIFTR